MKQGSADVTERLCRILVIFLLFVAGIELIVAASNLSIWGDELDTIRPAFLPFTGVKNFFWQIYQYPGCPPGDYFLLKLFYESHLFENIHRISDEIFWRLPYITLYLLTGLSTYFLSMRWTKAPLVSLLIFCAFLVQPGPFIFGIETRFYAWIIFFMTLSVWQTLVTIDRGFRLKDLFALSIINLVGVFFHVAMAIPIYIFLAFSVGNLFWQIYRIQKGREQMSRESTTRIVTLLVCGFIPYFFFKFEKHLWIFLPGGMGYFAALSTSLHNALTEIPSLISSNLRWKPFWSPLGFWAVCILLLVAGVVSLKKRNWRTLATSVFLFILLPMGSFALLISTDANHYSHYVRNYLFEVPVLVATVSWLIFSKIREWAPKIPSPIRTVVIIAAALFTFQCVLEQGNGIAFGSPSKANYDLAQFRAAYRVLPDRRRLVLVGVPMEGDGEFSWNIDSQGYISDEHVFYTKEFNPLNLTIRAKPRWKLPSTPAGWNDYDLLIFGPLDFYKSHFVQIPWSSSSCTYFEHGPLYFCRPHVTVPN